METNYAIEMLNITKRFPGIIANDNITLKLKKGEIHALVGENGAGKSTLMNELSGIYPYGSYEGDIVYDGEICKFKEIKDMIITVPAWMSVDTEKLEGKILALPTRDQIDTPVAEHLIVELYSK